MTDPSEFTTAERRLIVHRAGFAVLLLLVLLGGCMFVRAVLMVLGVIHGSPRAGDGSPPAYVQFPESVWVDTSVALGTMTMAYREPGVSPITEATFDFWKDSEPGAKLQGTLDFTWLPTNWELAADLVRGTSTHYYELEWYDPTDEEVVVGATTWRRWTLDTWDDDEP